MLNDILCGICLAGVIALSSACSGLPLQPKTPEISLAGIQITKLALNEQRFRVRLRIQNPNDFALPIHALDYVLRLNDQDFAKGASTHPIPVPALGESELELDVGGRLQNALPQLVALGTGSSLKYSLSGNVALSDFLFKLPFSKQGKVSLRP